MNFTDSNSNNQPADTTTIYRHQKKPEWGCAILLWERREKRGYQFEDGKQRVFGASYCDFFTQEVRPVDETRMIAENLLRASGVEPQLVTRSKCKAIPLADQIALFQETYAHGFKDDGWTKQKRGAGAKKRLKRHREALIEQARELLSRERIDEHIANGRHAEVLAAMIQLTDATDLTSTRDAQPLSRVSGDGVIELTVTLRNLLYGSDEYAIRFERFVAVLRRTTRATPTWQLATLFPAVVHPSEHLYVKPKTTDLQAQWMAPGLAMTKIPTGPAYDKLRAMALALGERLGNAALAPQDLLDLHDFMWETLRPKARKLIAERRSPSFVKLAA